MLSESYIGARTHIYALCTVPAECTMITVCCSANFCVFQKDTSVQYLGRGCTLRAYLCRTLSVIGYMLHRDVKPENILLLKGSKTGQSQRAPALSAPRARAYTRAYVFL